MKILHCTAQLPMRTGSGVYFSVLLQGLENLGHENVALFGTEAPYTSELLNSKLFSKIKTYPVEFLTPSLPFPIAGMSDVMPYQSTLYSQMTSEMFDLWIRAFEKTLIDARNNFNPEVVIVHHAFILASLVQKIFFDKKIICICHGTDIRQIKQNPNLKQKYIFNLDKINTFCVVSPKSKLDLKEIFSIDCKNIFLLGGGFDPKVFKTRKTFLKKTKLDHFKILYAGKVSKSKGVFELAKSFPIILEKHPKTQLSIVGNTSHEQMRELKQNAKNTKNLKFYNALNQLELSRLFQTYDLFVMPSYYETLGLIAIEALACAIRVVTTEIEGLQTLLGPKVNSSGVIEYVKLPRLYDTDKAVDEDKPLFVKNLSDKILSQLSRIQNGEQIPDTVLNEIQSHSWDKIVEKVNNILKS